MAARITTCLMLLLAVSAGSPTAWASDAGGRPDAGVAESTPDAERAFDASLEQTFRAPETPRVGDDLELTLEIEHPTNATVTLPEAFGTARWELENTQRSTAATQAEAEKTTLELTFQVFRTGATTLPSFDVTVLDERGRVATLATDPVETKIISVLDAEEKAELLPPRPTVEVWVEDYTLAWVGGVVGAASIAALIVFLLMRRREEDAYLEPERPAHVIALEKLSSLSPGELLDRGQYMIFYVRMSEAVREYLGRRYGFHGTELTTTEILDHLEEVDWPDSLSFEEVRSWMHHCDLIKFSGQVPSREDADDALRRAFAIVELTRPPEKPSPEEREAPAAEAQRVSQDPDDVEERSPYAPEPDAESPDEHEPDPPAPTGDEGDDEEES